MPNKPDKIIVHHTAATEPLPQFDAINDWHKARDFPVSSLGFYVGYQYVIEKDGTIKTARSETEEGAHTLGQNFSSVGICLVGNFDIELPTQEQIDALTALMSQVANRHNIEPTSIYPHRHFANKDCYGTKLDFNWARLLFIAYEKNRIAAAEGAINNGLQ